MGADSPILVHSMCCGVRPTEPLAAAFSLAGWNCCVSDIRFLGEPVVQRGMVSRMPMKMSRTVAVDAVVVRVSARTIPEIALADIDGGPPIRLRCSLREDVVALRA